MERKQMMKINWKPYMFIEYKHQRMEIGIECMLISINFDDEVLELQPMGENYYQQSFFSAIQNCHIPKRLRVATIDGKKVNQEVVKTESKQQPNFKNTKPAS